MDKLKKAKRGALIRALILTLMLIAGIPMIPIGFVFDILPVGIIGIAFTVIGFYGCPVAWVAFGGYGPMLRIVYAVENESLYQIDEIAQYLQKNPKEVAATINKAIEKLYLEGYFFDGKTLTLNENKKLKRKNIYTKCPHCGAPLAPQGEKDEFVKCPYCGSVINL